MLFYASKFLQQFAYPFNLAALSLLAAWLCLHRGKSAAAKKWLTAGLILTLVPAVPIFGDLLLTELETAVESPPIANYPKAEAIVVLGGSSAPARRPRNEAEEMGGARMLKAARMFKAGKAPIVIVSGGGQYSANDGSVRTEADDMADVLEAMGVPASAIIKQGRSRTTYEDALFSAELLKERKIEAALLVTSAFHQRRACALFRKQGIEVIPAPSGFLAAGGQFAFHKLLPSPSGMERTTLAIKEYVGFAAYRLMGKL